MPFANKAMVVKYIRLAVTHLSIQENPEDTPGFISAGHQLTES